MDLCRTPKLVDGVMHCVVDCSRLLLGQYLCPTTIDPATQQPPGCGVDNRAEVPCTAVDGLLCRETGTRDFTRSIECRWSNGSSLSTALLLAVFGGVVGADRWYLGHLGMATLKFFTLGFLLVGMLVDIILLATDHLHPIDGSRLVTGYYGQGVECIRSGNGSFVVQRGEWF